ncbi:MAG TPA: hypothetical protein VEH52_14300 [Gaiellaceae bacterium]|nr:hypothetical protein [Gaiellaceae bacterium]
MIPDPYLAKRPSEKPSNPVAYAVVCDASAFPCHHLAVARGFAEAAPTPNTSATKARAPTVSIFRSILITSF